MAHRPSACRLFIVYYGVHDSDCCFCIQSGCMELLVHRLRLKVPPPIIALLCGLLIWWLNSILPAYADQATLRRDIALLLLATAMLVDMTALIHFIRARTTIDPRYPHKTSSIVESGIYTYTRNPMYLGLVLILTSLSIWLGSLFGLPVVAVFVYYMTRFQIEAEEEMLTAQFGSAYLAYKARVRRWI